MELCFDFKPLLGFGLMMYVLTLKYTKKKIWGSMLYIYIEVGFTLLSLEIWKTEEQIKILKFPHTFVDYYLLYHLELQ